VKVLEGEARIFEPEEQLRAEGGAGDSCGYSGPAEGNCDWISEVAAETNVGDEGYDVGEQFEEEVRVDCMGAKVNVDGERDREMGDLADGEL